MDQKVKKGKKKTQTINSWLAQQGVQKAVRRKRSEFKEMESLPTCREQKSHTTWQVKCKQEIKRMEINLNSTLQWILSFLVKSSFKTLKAGGQLRNQQDCLMKKV